MRFVVVLCCDHLKLKIMDFEVLLTSWGLRDYIPAFKDEGINDESFCLLDDETIKAIFFKKGPLLVFKKHYKEHFNSKISFVTASDVSIETISTAFTETVSSANDNEYQLFDADFLDDFNTVEKTAVCSEVSSEEHLFKSPPPPLKRINDDPGYSGEPVAKRLNSGTIFPNGLEKYLESHADGKVVILNKGKLNNLLRQKLAKIIINFLVSKSLDNPNFEIKSEIFQRAAGEIVKIFPSEQVETYYIPFISKRDGLRQPARGKLWSRYINVRAALRSAEVKTKLSDPVIPDVTPSPSLLFLKAAVEPESKISQAWEETRSLRTILYKRATSEDIFIDFPVLATPLGITLVAITGAWPTTVPFTLYTEWPKIADAIINEAKDRSIKTLDETNADKSTRALLILPSLFSLQTIKRSGKNSWRPTRIEVQESFFDLEKNLEDLEKSLQKRKSKLDAFEITLQPFAVGIGDINEKIDCFYVVINSEIKYRCESSIRCLELLYKCIHSLNLNYPLESKSILLFIQDMVFKMGGVGKSGSTAEVIGDIIYQLSKQ